MSQKHTPGPWVSIGSTRDGVYSFTVYTDATYPEGSGNNLQVCAGYGGLSSGFPVIEEARGNASLIAAAPDLLEALEGIMDAVKRCEEDDDKSITDEFTEELEIVALAAIAKAKGETQ